MKGVEWAYIFPITILREQTMWGTLFVPFFFIKEGKSEGTLFFPSDKGNKEWWGTLPPLLSNGKRKCVGTLLALCCLPIKL